MDTKRFVLIALVKCSVRRSYHSYLCIYVLISLCLLFFVAAFYEPHRNFRGLKNFP